jgi:hypothetical protein
MCVERNLRGQYPQRRREKAPDYGKNATVNVKI